MTVSSLDKMMRDAKRHLKQLKKISGSQESLTSEITGTFGVFGKDLILDEPRREDRPFRFNPESPSNWDYWDFFYGHLSVTVLPLPLAHINHAAAVCLRADSDVGGIVYKMHKLGWPNHMRAKLFEACHAAIGNIEPHIRQVEEWHGWTDRKREEVSGYDSLVIDRTETTEDYITQLRAGCEDLMFWVMVDYQKNPDLWFESCGIQAEELPAMSADELEIYDDVDSVKIVSGKVVLPPAKIVVNDIPINPRPKDRQVDDDRLKRMRREAAALLRGARRRK